MYFATHTGGSEYVVSKMYESDNILSVRSVADMKTMALQKCVNRKVNYTTIACVYIYINTWFDNGETSVALLKHKLG